VVRAVCALAIPPTRTTPIRMREIGITVNPIEITIYADRA
jgi:hypothetical protein